MNEVNNIKLSVVILVYNTEEFLHQCFDSLINQTLQGIEIIAVDDESPDNSLEICREYEAKYSNFRIITQKNQGGAVAGTTGMKEAKGKYVALVDSDDFLSPNAYEMLYNMCEENSADIAIGKPLRYINEKKLEVILPEEQAVWEEKKVINSFKEIQTLFHDKFYWNKIFRRDFIEKYQIYMPAGYLYADFLMVHKAYEFASKIAITNEIVYFWRRHEATRQVKSASQEIASCENFKERTKSLLFQNSENQDIRRIQDDMKLLLLSFVFNNIVEQKVFRNTFMQESTKVLDTIQNIEGHNVHPLNKLRLWLLKEGYINELFYLIGKPAHLQLKDENKKVYCNLPFFKNNDFNIPDEVYEYKMFRAEFIKNFLYLDNGKNFTFQVLLQYIHCLPKSDYYLFFKDKYGTTKYKCLLHSNGDYFSCTVIKDEIFKNYDRLFLGIGNNENIIYRIDRSNTEPTFDISRKLNYIVNYSWNKNEVYFQNRNLMSTIKRKLRF